MPSPEPEVYALRSDNDIVAARAAVRNAASAVGLSGLGQTKVVTAASELARNALEHGGGGCMTLERIEVGHRRGVRLTFEDDGPGIADIDRALTDRFSTGGGMGLGLGGAKRLCSTFDIRSAPGTGTCVVIVQWA